MVAWRGGFPMDCLPESHRGPVASAWVGPHGHILHYPLRGGKVPNFVTTIERDDWQTESWSTQGTTEECARDFV
jgi:salicylate hydroxylase